MHIAHRGKTLAVESWSVENAKHWDLGRNADKVAESKMQNTKHTNCDEMAAAHSFETLMMIHNG